MYKKSSGEIIFSILNYTLLSMLGLLCLMPFINILAISFSSNSAVVKGSVSFWPIDFNVRAYYFVLQKQEFWRAFLVTIKRVFLGGIINFALTVTVAYALSKETKAFPLRNIFAWYFVFTILFSGGLIPLYMTIKQTNLLGKIWSLVLPGALPVFNMLILMNFFRGIPKEIEESCFIDGAGHLKILLYMYLPLSTAAIATITLFSLVGHWNAWFDGLIYMNRPRDYPLTSYLQTVIAKVDYQNMTIEQIKLISELNDRTLRAAQIFLSAVPILLVYPVLQKYFMTGLILGSVKA